MAPPAAPRNQAMPRCRRSTARCCAPPTAAGRLLRARPDRPVARRPHRHRQRRLALDQRPRGHRPHASPARPVRCRRGRRRHGARRRPAAHHARGRRPVAGARRARHRSPPRRALPRVPRGPGDAAAVRPRCARRGSRRQGAGAAPAARGQGAGDRRRARRSGGARAAARVRRGRRHHRVALSRRRRARPSARHHRAAADRLRHSRLHPAGSDDADRRAALRLVGASARRRPAGRYPAVARGRPPA